MNHRAFSAVGTKPEPPAEPNRVTLDVGHISVSLSVKLAEVRMTLGQLRSLGTGAILPVEVPIDDRPLEIQVNRQAIGSGTTVRNGAMLGVKLTRIGDDCRSATR